MYLVLVLLSPLILYLLTLIVIGLFAFGDPLGFYLLTLNHLTAVTGDELMPGEQTQQAVFGDYVRLRMPLVRAEVSTSHGIYNIQCP